jgi:rhodanese-related sulfurtransferase
MAQFSEMLRHKDFILINVHIPYQGEIPNTDTLIPFNSMDQPRSKLPEDKNAKIVVYCMTGPMGYIAAEKLTNMGYTNVLHFEGGMQAWARSARQLIHRQK